MSHLLRAALLAFALTSVASAQTVDTVIDSVLFHTGAPFTVDRARFLPFGFGRNYTDSIDQDLPVGYEREIPAFPPQSFYVLFDALTVPAWIDRDIRGIPDSVLSGRATHFAIRHEFGIQRGQDPNVTIVFPRLLPPNIDSINFRDIIGGAGGLVFSETISSGPDSVVVPNNNLTTVRMIVYYNARNIPTAIPRVPNPVDIAMRLVPNPVRKSSTARAIVAAPDGSRLDVVNQVGRIVMSATRDRIGDSFPVIVDGLAAGVYVARITSPDGGLVASRAFVIAD